ncbi:uncharacterized protein [Periplaneta americana]|uniref:uncharacterized protein n=1 Tax=Periplaneta americana TaxID=6978 RepID=UPI0037E8A6D1
MELNIYLAVLLVCRCFVVEAVEERSSNSSERSSTNASNEFSEPSIIPLENIAFALDEKTFVQLTNMQLLIPADLDLGKIDPDFSKMILHVNSLLGSLEVKGDYAIFVHNVIVPPYSSQGRVHMKLSNITAVGEMALALTPAALIVISFNFRYHPESLSVQIVPARHHVVTQELRLSKELTAGAVGGLVNSQVEDHLNYYVDAHINFILSRITLFTIGRKNSELLGAGEPFTQNVNIGDLFDEMLVDVRKEILTRSRDEIAIPDFQRNFTEKLETKTINGTFEAVDGWIAGLSTLKRASNVSLSKHGDKFVLSALIELDSFDMAYDKYEAKFLTSEVKGELDGTFLHRKLTLKVSMEPKSDGTCVTALKELRAFKFNGYRINNITEIGSFEWLKIRINNWLVGFFQVTIVKDVEKELSVAVSNSLSHFDCGEYLPHLKIVTSSSSGTK